MSLEAIEAATLSEYVKLAPRQLRLDMERGSRDGRRGSPALQSTTHTFMEELCSQAAQAYNNFDVEISRHADRLDKRREDLETQRSGKYEVRRNDLSSQKQVALSDLDRTIGPSSHAMITTQAESDTSMGQFRDLEARLNRPLRVSLKYVYLPLLLMALLIEAPINRLAFELFFQETALISWGLAALVGCLLLAFAHFVGVSARRLAGTDSKWMIAGRITFIVAMLGVACALMYFVAKVRQAYIAFIESEQAQDAQLGAILRGEQISIPGLQDLLSIPLGQDGMLLILINFTIFVVAALASFYRHDPHPDYEKVSDRREKSERRLAKLKLRFEAENSRVAREFDTRIGDLDRQIDNVEKEIANLDAELEAVRGARERNEVRVAKAVKSRLWQYQRGNLESRSDGTPACFTFTDEDLFRKIFGSISDASVVRILESVKGAGQI